MYIYNKYTENLTSLKDRRKFARRITVKNEFGVERSIWISKCFICKREFQWVYKDSDRIYCSDLCRKNKSKKIRKEYKLVQRILTKKRRDERRKLKRNRLHECVICGEKFKLKTDKQRSTCSKKCKEKQLFNRLQNRPKRTQEPHLIATSKLLYKYGKDPERKHLINPESYNIEIPDISNLDYLDRFLSDYDMATRW